MSKSILSFPLSEIRHSLISSYFNLLFISSVWYSPNSIKSEDFFLDKGLRVLHLPVLPKHFVFVYHKHKISVIAAEQTEGKHWVCSSLHISHKGKFQHRSTGGHLLFLVNKMPFLKSIPECDMATGSKFCPFFSSSFSENFHCCWWSQSRDQKQRGAKQKGKWKKALVFQRAGNRKFFCKCVSLRMKRALSGHERRKLKILDALPDVQGLWLTKTLEHLQVALGPSSGGLNMSISAGADIDASRNRRASGLYRFDLPFIHHLNVLKPIIKEIISIKSSIIPSVMCLFLINLICPWWLSGDKVS